MDRNLKQGMKPSLEHDLPLSPGLAGEHVVRLEEPTADHPIIDFCTNCGFYGLLSRIDAKLIDAICAEAPGSDTNFYKNIPRENQFCAICSVEYIPHPREFAIMRGYAWYLIGRAESAEQVTINRLLWKAAVRSAARYRTAERDRLRDALAKCPETKGFDLPSRGLNSHDLAHIQREIEKILDATAVIKSRGAETRTILESTLGMHHLLKMIEGPLGPLGIRLAPNAEASRKPIPAWYGNHRYLLTVRGLERVAKGIPLGRDLRENEAALSPLSSRTHSLGA